MLGLSSWSSWCSRASSDFRNVQLAAMAYLGIAAGGLTVLTGLNGQISLGHGALMAIGAYTDRRCCCQDGEPPLPLLGILLVAVAGRRSLVGALVGVAAARLHGPYLAGATLALAVAVPGIALYFSDTLGGEQGLRVRLPEIPAWVLDAAYFVTGSELTRSKLRGLPRAGSSLIVAFVLLANLSRSRVGRRWRAVRDDEVAAELAGIHLGRARVSAFVVSAAAAGAAGAVMAFVGPARRAERLHARPWPHAAHRGRPRRARQPHRRPARGRAADLPARRRHRRRRRSAGLDDIRAAQLAPLVYGLVMVAVILLAPAGLVGLRSRSPLRSARPAAPGPTRLVVRPHRRDPDRGRAPPRRETSDDQPPDQGPRALDGCLRRARGRRPAAVVLSACGGSRRRGGGATDVGVTDDSVKIGAHFPLTGVAAPGYSEIPTGAQAYFDYVNAAGGVNGRTIEYLVTDDGYDPTKTSTVTNELVLKDKIFAMVGGLGTPTHGAVVDFLNDEGVPDLFVSSGLARCGARTREKPVDLRLADRLRERGQDHRPVRRRRTSPTPRSGLFLQDDDFGDDGEKGLRQYLDEPDRRDRQRYTSGNTDVAPQIAALQAVGRRPGDRRSTPRRTPRCRS